MKEPKFKKGEKVDNRIIVEVVPCLDYGGKPSFRYGYKYEHEPEDVDLIWCAESTIIRKFGRK